MDGTAITSGKMAPRASCAQQVRNRSAGIMMCANERGESRFASEDRELALRLTDHDFPTQVIPARTQQEQLTEVQAGVFSKKMRRLSRNQLDLAESVLYQSGAPTGWNLDFHGRCRVGRAAFGTDQIPNGWAERCNALDEIWVPTEFHRERFGASGVERSKIRVIHRAVDTQIFCPGRPPLQFPSVPVKSFQFVAIADGILSAGVDVLIRSFVAEFAPDDDVSLMLHCPPTRRGDRYVDFEAEVIALIETDLEKDLEDVPTIALVMGSLSDIDRARMFAASRAFVQPARAEATGQHCIEALACQLPVIATDWGPLNDFLTDQNSFPLATCGIVPARPDEDELVAGHRWAEPNLDHLRASMREVFTNEEEAARRAEQGRRDVLEKFDWNVVLPEWTQNLQRLLN